MADIELVIKIPEETYNLVKSWNYPTDTAHRMLFELVTNGVPIPKGHGRLKDVDKLETHDEYDGQGFTKSVYQDDIDNLPTIIEADKGESEDKDVFNT